MALLSTYLSFLFFLCFYLTDLSFSCSPSPFVSCGNYSSIGIHAPPCPEPFNLSCNPSTNQIMIQINGSGPLFLLQELSLPEHRLVLHDLESSSPFNKQNCSFFVNITKPYHGFNLSLHYDVFMSEQRFFDCTKLEANFDHEFFLELNGTTPCKSYNFYYTNRSLDNQTLEALPPYCSTNWEPSYEWNFAFNGDGVLFLLSIGFSNHLELKQECFDCGIIGSGCSVNGGRRTVCQEEFQKEKRTKLIITGIVIPTVVILLVGVIVFVKFRAKALSIFGSFSAGSLSRTDSDDVKEFIKTYRSTLTIEFSYKELKKTTDGFKHKLGSGGCGNVYKGKLATGQLIAVKVLEKSSQNGRDFINEVATIGMIRHVNIIKLLGYCCDGPHRALVYEFMPQGSLADLLSRKEDKNILGAQKLFEIAIDVAQGIEYLHQGCDQRILHLDIKPQNVLLDSNLQPKISDFGLAKFYSKKDSTVSLTGARGTIGYIAPEVFMRSLGVASHKSDVYSYGMLLLELIVGRTNCNSEHKTGETEEEAYFPDWIYDQMKKWADMELEDSVVDFEISVSRKMVMVGLWCIQVNPVDRPSISTAIGMLTGRLESIAMPPKPLLIFPPKREMSQCVEACVSGGDLSLMSVGLSEITER